MDHETSHGHIIKQASKQAFGGIRRRYDRPMDGKLAFLGVDCLWLPERAVTTFCARKPRTYELQLMPYGTMLRIKASRTTILFPILILISLSLSTNARQTVSIALFTDPSCSTNPYTNDFHLGADFCGVPTELTSSRGTESFLTQFESLRLIDRPVCTNGSFATFVTYSDQDCEEQIQQYGLERLDGELSYTDGQCVESVGFATMAFICNGFDEPDSGKANMNDETRTSDLYGRDAGGEDGYDGSGFTIQTDTDVSTVSRSHNTFPTPRLPIPIAALPTSDSEQGSSTGTTASSSVRTGNSTSTNRTISATEVTTSSSTSGIATSGSPQSPTSSVSSTAPAAATTPANATGQAQVPLKTKYWEALAAVLAALFLVRIAGR